jgi:hypothetical protein
LAFVVHVGNPLMDNAVEMIGIDEGLIGADSDDVARSFRDHVARCSDMMSPA